MSKQTISGRSGLAGRDQGARAHTKPTQLGTPAGKRQQIVDEAYQRTPTAPLVDGQWTGNRKGGV